MTEAATPIHALASDRFVGEVRSRIGVGRGAARAIYRRAVCEGEFAPEAHDLSALAVAAWRASFHLRLPEVLRVVREDGALGPAAKAVLCLDDGLEVECVSIPMGRGRHTLCVSSQVGCKMGCRFCETARMGLLRHLRVDEIVAQVLVARHRLGWPVRNVVFMGMGEALDNFEALSGALAVLTDPGGLAFAQERLTVCTVGHVDGIRRLAALGYKRLNLSVSLNATDGALRSELMPINRRYSLDQLMEALTEFRPRRNFTLGVNYCLMPGINDGEDRARALAELCRPLGRALVNLIPYNPGRAPLTRAPSEEEVERFVGWLREAGVPVRRRVTKGRAVMAACGQLGNAELRKLRVPVRG